MSAKRSEAKQQNGPSYPHMATEGLNSPLTPPGRVLFCSEDDYSKDTRKDASRFLTAKYQKQQMGMIRKRIAIEDWIEEELPSLMKKDEEEDDDEDASLDLDDILKIPEDEERMEYIKDKLSQVALVDDAASVDTIIKNLIEKLQELK